MRVLIRVLVIVSFATFAFAIEPEGNKTKEETTTDINLEDAELQKIDELSLTKDKNPDDTEVKRKKKSTTTFCVEIRPSGPYQKPFQVCEPSEPAKPAATAPASSPEATSYYAAPSYSAPEQPKPQEPYQPATSAPYKPASQKPAAAYSAPMKNFAAPASKPFAGHAPMPYSSYRSKNAEGGGEDHVHDHMHMMRMTHASEEEEANFSSESTSEQQMRSASYGYGGSSYGSPGSMFPVVPKQKPKGHGHNGLVITCQPNLAGYAHNVPSSYHHPSAVSYGYRSSTPKGFEGYHYTAQPQAYGGYQQASGQSRPMPMFKPSGAGSSQGAKPTHSSSYGPYKQQMFQHTAPTYQSQVYKPQAPPTYAAPPAYAPPPPPPTSYAPPPQAPPTSYAPPPQAPPTSYAPPPQAPMPTGYSSAQPIPSPPQSYSSFSQPPAQPPPPPPASSSPEYAPAAYGPPPMHTAPEYAPAPAPISSGPSAAYAPAPPPPPRAPPAPPQAPAYAPPATYRESEVETEVHSKVSSPQSGKEKQTVKKMQEISQQRAAGSQWATEIPTEGSQKKKTEEHVGASQGQAWASRMSDTSREADDVKISEMDQQAKNNEVDSV